MTDPDATIRYFQESLNLTPEGHPARASLLEALGYGYSSRSIRKGTEADLNTAIQYYQESLNLTPIDHPDRAKRLKALGNGYRDRYLENRTEADLDTAIGHIQESLNLTPKDHPDRARRLEALGDGFRDRYSEKGAEADLDTAIGHLQESLNLTPEDHPDRASRLEALGDGYRSRAIRKGVNADLDTAIRHLQESLTLTPEDHPDRASRLEALGNGYRDRYLEKGTEADLHTAIGHLQESLNLTPNDHPDRASRLEALGDGLRDRYLEKGVEADLDTAIRYFQGSLDITPKDHPNRAKRLEALGDGYRARYLDKRTEADLDTAIHYFQESLNITPTDHPDRASRLEALGYGFRDRYLEKGVKADLKTAIQHFQESLNLTPDAHPDQARRLQALGNAYRDRYLENRTEADLDTAIGHLQGSLNLTPKDHPGRAGRLEDLGYGYRSSFTRNRTEADLDIAIRHFQESLNLTPKGHLERASRLDALGDAYRVRSVRNGTQADLDRSIQHFQESLDHFPSPTLDRLRSGVSLSRIYAGAGNWTLAYQSISTTASLIARLTPRSLQTSDKQHLLSEVVGLASDTAAIALMAEQTPYEAIRLLELGRGVIIASLNEMRADISDLQQKHPQLAEGYMSLRNQLDTPTTLTGRAGEPRVPAVFANPADRRYNAGQKLEQMIQDIRRLPGFERFLLAPTEDEVKVAAASGPIVVINVSNYRCDAFIVEKHGLRALRLPDLKSEDVRARAATLAEPETQLLEWLWDTIAKPVLDALGFTQTPGNSWPRIWWVPTGPLTRFPIHAAGYHGSSNTVLDRVISSYSSSIRALIQGRQRPSKALPNVSGKAVLVGMENTPGHTSLQYVPKEIERLGRLCRSMQLDVTRPQSRLDDVLSELRDCDIFHFAGHGLTDQDDPSKSSLLLSDGGLAVASLFELNLHSRAPFLAYLSACGTGEVKGDNLLDEALHLINACQLAGFRHVIGTLWKVNDQSCVEAAATTYEWMKRGNLSDDSVADGLHRASRHLRSLWNRESAACESKRMAPVRTKDGPAAIGQSRSSQATRDPRTAELYEDPPLYCVQDAAREPRDVVSCDDIPLYWVPYVHFGV
jgi:CHAT domain-containing protein